MSSLDYDQIKNAQYHSDLDTFRNVSTDNLTITFPSESYSGGEVKGAPIVTGKQGCSST